MAETQRVIVTINIGADAPISTLAATIGDLSTVCQFASELQRTHDRNEAAYRFVRGRPPFFWYEDRDWAGFATPPINLERAISRDLRERNAEDDATVRVERLAYRNPIEIVILASGIVVIQILQLLRDWRDHRRMTDAAASDYEDTVRTRTAMRQLVRDSVESGDFRLSSEQIDRLLEPSTLDALAAITASDVRVQTLSGGEDRSAR